MKQRLLILTIILLMPFSYVYAYTPISDYPKEKNIKVSVDYTTIQDGLAVSFSNEPVPESRSYEDYDNLKDIGATIVIKPTNGELVARETDSLYLNWQIYTKQVLDLYLKISGPLSVANGQSINWKVSLVRLPDGTFASVPGASGTVVSIGSDQHGLYDYSSPSKSSILIHSTEPKKSGYSGSCNFSIVTESLLGFDVDKTYEATLTAEILTRT